MSFQTLTLAKEWVIPFTSKDGKQLYMRKMAGETIQVRSRSLEHSNTWCYVSCEEDNVNGKPCLSVQSLATVLEHCATTEVEKGVDDSDGLFNFVQDALRNLQLMLVTREYIANSLRKYKPDTIKGYLDTIGSYFGLRVADLNNTEKETQ